MSNAKSEDKPYLKQLTRELLAETFGTFLLILIGCSSVAAFILNPNPNQYMGHYIPRTVDFAGVCYCWGFAALIAISASIEISGAHLNPAVSIALATRFQFPWIKVVPYIIAQMVGGFLGALVTYLVYLQAILKQHDLPDLKDNTTARAYGNAFSTGGIFATYPAEHVSIYGAFFDQVLATALLLIGVMCCVDQNNLKVPKYLQPLLLGFLIALLIQAFGFNTNCPLNPARDFAPRFFCMMAGWGTAPFKPLSWCYWWLVGIVAPIVGGIVGVWIYYFVIEFLTPKSEDNPGQETKPETQKPEPPRSLPDAQKVV